MGCIIEPMTVLFHVRLAHVLERPRELSQVPYRCRAALVQVASNGTDCLGSDVVIAIATMLAIKVVFVLPLAVRQADCNHESSPTRGHVPLLVHIADRLLRDM